MLSNDRSITNFNLVSCDVKAIQIFLGLMIMLLYFNLAFAADPIASYSFDVDASDATGNYDGTLEGDAAIVDDGERGKVVEFTADGYVDITASITDEMEDFSFSTWVNYDGDVQWAGLLGMGLATSGGFPYWDFHMRADSILSFYSSLDVVWESDGCAQFLPNFRMPYNEWTHIAFAFTLDEGASVYINGVAQDLENWVGPNDFHVAPSMIGAEDVNIGRDTFNHGTLTHTKIDNFQFYKIPLSANQVLKIYNDQKIDVEDEKSIKIMPVGNSITAGEHYGKPANAERTGYRKDLYWMLIKAGYNVDFVGSQTHGERSEDDPDWYDWNNEAYPGWQINSIANRVSSALPKYNPDILLFHVGTNGDSWDDKPGQVMDMLDMINDFSVEHNHPMIVFLCKIINRFKGGHAPTTQFNNDVTDLVAGRSGDKIKIIMVDMENGAGLDYSDAPPDFTANPPYEGGDMWGETYPGVSYDLFHPNDKGNTKMAVKLYEELFRELEEPTKIEKY